VFATSQCQCVSERGSKSDEGTGRTPIPGLRIPSKSYTSEEGAERIATYLFRVRKIAWLVSVSDVHRGRGVHEQGIGDRVFVVTSLRPPDWRISRFDREWGEVDNASAHSPPPLQSPVHSFAM